MLLSLQQHLLLLLPHLQLLLLLLLLTLLLTLKHLLVSHLLQLLQLLPRPQNLLPPQSHSTSASRAKGHTACAAPFSPTSENSLPRARPASLLPHPPATVTTTSPSGALRIVVGARRSMRPCTRRGRP